MALKSEQLFNLMEKYIQDKGAEEIIKKVKAVFFFEIAKTKGEEAKWFTVDLKNGSGSVTSGKNGTADATFTMLDNDVIDMATGKLNPQQAFMQGKMKIKGNMAAAMKFTPDLLPKLPGL